MDATDSRHFAIPPDQILLLVSLRSALANCEEQPSAWFELTGHIAPAVLFCAVLFCQNWIFKDWTMTSQIMPERRPLTHEERTLVEWLIANGSADAQDYSPQVADLSVVGRCTCGCPTIDLAVGSHDRQKTAPSKLLADFIGTTPGGIEVGVILHAREGEISELEVCAITDVNVPFTLPTIQSLKQF